MDTYTANNKLCEAIGKKKPLSFVIIFMGVIFCNFSKFYGYKDANGAEHVCQDIERNEE